jgi:uncharacterized protein
MDSYRRRIVDDELDELLASLPAIALEGAKGVGKTRTASERVDQSFALDNPSVVQLLKADLAQLDAVGTSVLIDEWQRYPAVWDHVRRQVDGGASPGSYILAGSAIPIDAPSHSGAGRIVNVRMRPLSLAERGIGLPSVSLGDLLGGEHPDIRGTTRFGLVEYVDEILASGFPAIRRLGERARRAQLDGYVARMVEHDFPEQGVQIRRPATLMAWLRAYAAATATTTSYNTLLKAATPGESEKPARTTTTTYRDVLAQLWLLDPVPGWLPTRSHVGRLSVAPKHHLADPALAASLVGVDANALLSARETYPIVARDSTFLGALFESLVTVSVRVYAQAHEATVHHLRTRDGRHEVDLIVERRDHRVLALKVKLAENVDDDSCRHLDWLKEEIGDDLVDSAVITTGKNAFRRSDGIAVIPASLLGP